MTKADLWNLPGTKSKPLADAPQYLNVALPIVAEREALSEIYLTGLKTVADEPLNELDSRHVCELTGEVKHNYLTHAEVFEPFHFLMERLKEWWCSLRLQHLTGMRVKSNQRGSRINEQCTLDDGMDDGLMTQMKTVKYSQRKHRWPAN